ncbi:hypothetical protein [Streptomyces sp. ODS05-4]|uniref:hypothetical protein n=1 Tax=Streptomyces sp. ODS05-4 TaxID=2944939 RepID=UPI0021099623|nr:hypothetical protein [Streptomyces sp. ODS05-4]
MPDSNRTRQRAEQDAYHVTLLLHALSTLTRQSEERPDGMLRLVRAVVGHTGRLTADVPVPMDSLRYDGPRELLSGVGALIAEDLQPGSAGLALWMPALREAGLIDELYDFAARAEELFPAATAGRPAPPAPDPDPDPDPDKPDVVYTLMRPVAGWSALATLHVCFSAGSPALPAESDTSAHSDPAVSTSPHTNWSPLSDTFEAEAALALAHARRLVVDQGLGRPTRVTASFQAPGMQAPSSVCDGVSAAAVALTYLAQETDLPSPARLGVVVIAGVEVDGRHGPWKASDDVHLGETARASGLTVLSLTANGWSLEGRGAPKVSGDRTLNGAAELLWGGAWEEARDRRHAELLRGWRIVYASPTDRAPQGADSWQEDPDEPPLVETDQVDTLYGQFLLRPRQGMLLAGSANSGKSVIARQLTARLERSRWKVLALSPADRRLPAEGDLPAIVSAAMHLTGVQAGARKLVVIEDLHPREQGDVGRHIGSLADELDVRALALIRCATGSETESDSALLSPLTAVAGEAEVAALARRMVEREPHAYGGAAADLPALLATAQGDLWLLSRAMYAATAAEQTPERHRSPADPTRIAEALRGVRKAERAVLRLVAAASLIGSDLPAEYVTESALEALGRLGARSSPVAVSVPSRVLARSLLRELTPVPDTVGATGAGDPHETVEPLGALLLRLLHDDRPDRVVNLLQACRAYDSRLLDRLLDRRDILDALAAWTDAADVTWACTILSICDHPEQSWLRDRLLTVMSRIPAAGGWTARQMSPVIKLVVRRQYVLTASAEFADLMRWLAAPDGGLAAVMDRPASLKDRYHLAWQVSRLPHEAPPQLITGLTDVLVRDVREDSAEDLVTLRKLDALLERCHRRSGASGPRRPPSSLEGHPEVEALLQRRPSKGARLGVILAWLALRLHVDGPAADWHELIDAHEVTVRRAFGKATAAEAGQALRDLSDTHKAFCTRLLSRVRATDKLRTLLREASPTEAADLLSVLSDIHGVTVRALLYGEAHEGLTADTALAEVLADRVLLLGDGKGAGLLLSATQRVDELYCTIGETFAGRLAARLGPAFARTLLARERRPPVLYHFLRGLRAAEAEYWHEVQQHALDLVVASIGSPNRLHHPWAARLGLLLVSDDPYGHELLTRLSQAVDPVQLAQRMTDPALPADTFLALHRLAAAIHPDLPQRYRQHFDTNRLLWHLQPAAPDSVALRLRATAHTLRMSGDQGAQTRLLSAFREAAPNQDWDWATKLREMPVTRLAHALDEMRMLDPALATEVVGQVDQAGDDERSGHLVDSVFRLASDPDRLVELLRAVDMAQPGQGRILLTLLREHRQAWTAFIERFQHLQDLHQQVRLGRLLAHLGVGPASGHLRWMKRLVQDRWLNAVSHLASPRAVRELLRLTCVWDEQWGRELSASISRGKLLARIGRGGLADLQEVPGLLHVLMLTRQRELALAVTDRLPQPDRLARALGLHGSSQLLRQLRALHPADMEPFAAATARLLASVVDEHLVVSPESHWTSIGWAAQALRETGFTDLLPQQPPRHRAIGAYAAQVSWAATWLPDSKWTQSALDVALPAFSQAPRVWQQGDLTAMVLIATARAGRLQGLTNEDAVYWGLSAEASPGLLTLAYRTGADHETLGRLLLALKPSIERRLNQRVHLVDPWRPELSTQLGRLPAEEPQPRSGLFGSGGLLGGR